MVGKVKALATFAYPHDEARRREAAEHLLNLSDTVNDVVEFWCDLARVGVVCGDVCRLVNGRNENVSESTNQCEGERTSLWHLAQSVSRNVLLVHGQV